MRRSLTLVIIIVFAIYLIATLGVFNIPHTKRITKPLSGIRKFIGAGSLFTRESTLENRVTLYRFYHNKQWGKWTEFERHYFNIYLHTLKYDALKHSVFDIILGQRLYHLGYLKNKTSLVNNLVYKKFMVHLLENHPHESKYDSIEFIYRKQMPDSTIKHKDLFRLKIAH